jgi:hypothetical protein
MIGVMASDYEGMKEMAWCGKSDKGGHMVEENRRKRRKRRDSGLTLWREADVEKERDTWQQGKCGKEDDMMGEGSTQAKHRAAENDGSA